MISLSKREYGKIELMRTVALTGKNSTNLDETPCDLTASPDRHFRRVTTQIQNSSDSGFQNATQSIYPILTVFMPVTNAIDRKSEFPHQANSSLRCIRARYLNTSMDVAPLPLGEPWVTGDHGKGRLSAGAKGGIAAGAAVVALILVCCAAWFYWRKRSRLYGRPQQGDSASVEPDRKAEASLHDKEKTAAEAKVASGMVDTASHDYKAQLDSTSMVELDANSGLAELGHIRDTVGGQ